MNIKIKQIQFFFIFLLLSFSGFLNHCEKSNKKNQTNQNISTLPKIVLNYKKGTVFNNKKKITNKTLFHSGDSFKTANYSKLAISIENQAIIYAGKKSKFSIHLENDFHKIDLSKGYLYINIKSGNRFKISTANLLVGVRGTELYIRNKGKGKKEKTYFCLCHGEVIIRSLKGKQKEKEIRLSKKHQSFWIDAKGNIKKTKRKYHSNYSWKKVKKYFK